MVLTASFIEVGPSSFMVTVHLESCENGASHYSVVAQSATHADALDDALSLANHHVTALEVLSGCTAHRLNSDELTEWDKKYIH